MNIFRFFNKSPLRRLDKKKIDIKESEVVVFSCVRNEILRLPFFLEYHRRLGVDRFIFVDNASTDGTKEYLLLQEDCHVFYTKASYADSHCGMDWIHELLSDYGVNHWILTLEPDELLIYPMCESVGLKLLTKYLDKIEAQAMKTFLLDMYSDKAIKDTCYVAGEHFLDFCRKFDSNSYYQHDDDGVPTQGGPRHRLFWQGDKEKRSPYLINIPLVKWRRDMRYESGTHVIPNVKVAPIIGGKQHFKFFSDFHAYAEAEAHRKEHWDNASEYVAYWDVLSDNPQLSAMYDGSLSYVDSMQLVRLGMMKQPASYTAFVRDKKSLP